MERRFSLGRIIISVIAVLLVCVFVFMLLNDSKLQNFLNSDYQQNNEYNYEQEQTISTNINKVHSSLEKSISSIVLYSDEYGGNGVLADRLHYTLNKELFSSLNDQIQKYPRIIGQSLDIPVTNFEIHGESFETILARIGTETVFTAKAFTMPAESDEKADVYLKTIAGSPVEFNTQTYVSLGNVSINGIEGQLSRSHSENDDGAYIFKRNISGEEMKIRSGAKVEFDISEQYRNSFPVIFFGKNDYSNTERYIQKHLSVIRHQTSDDKYIIICRTPANSELDTAMTENFGLNYIRTNDKIEYTDLAEKIYFRMKTLKYLDIISGSVKKAEQKIIPQG